MTDSTSSKDTPPLGVAALPAPVAAKPATSVPATPSLTGNTALNLGDFAAQFLKAVAPAAAEASGVVINALIAKTPMGVILQEFIGPTVISGYVSQALTSLEAVAASGNVTVNAANYVEATAAALFNTNEAHLAEYLGESVGPIVSALVAKIKF